MPERNHLKEERVILAYSFRSFNPWLASSIASYLMASNKQKDPEEKGQEKIYPQKIYLK
jgi:hypothetical protein